METATYELKAAFRAVASVEHFIYWLKAPEMFPLMAAFFKRIENTKTAALCCWEKGAKIEKREREVIESSEGGMCVFAGGVDNNLCVCVRACEIKR